MGQVRCAACQWPIEVYAWNDPQGVHCKHCAQLVYSYVFPAIHRAQVAELPEAVQEENEASCFYHPQSRAALHCDECGRFLCPVCDCPVEGRHLCPYCLNSAAKSKKFATFENQRTNYDSIALTAAIAPIFLFWPVTLISGPGTIYYSIKHWKSPRGILGRSKWRFVLAMLVGLAQTVGWVVLLFALLFARKTR